MRLPPNATASTTDFEFAALHEAANYRRTIRDRFAPHLQGSIIEVGAGIGQMTAEFLVLPGLERLLCVEPDARFQEQHAARHPGHELLRGIIQDVPAGSRWDGIVSINVLEHIERDAEELRLYGELLREKHGKICLLVPARPEIYSLIDKDFGHFRRYTRPALGALLEGAGFQIVQLEYFNLTGYFAWLWNFKIRQARNFTVSQVRLFDQKIFPVTQWCERKLPFLPIGQSLIAVGRA